MRLTLCHQSAVVKHQALAVACRKHVCRNFSEGFHTAIYAKMSPGLNMEKTRKNDDLIYEYVSHTNTTTGYSRCINMIDDEILGLRDSVRL